MIGVPLSLCTLLVLNSFRRITQMNNAASANAFKSMASGTANSSTTASCSTSPSSCRVHFLHGLGVLHRMVELAKHASIVETKSQLEIRIRFSTGSNYW
jgi:hypothetical protein